jgi:hypothetical protein
LTFAALVVGVLVGAVLNQWLRLDIVPIGVSEREGGGLRRVVCYGGEVVVCVCVCERVCV